MNKDDYMKDVLNIIETQPLNVKFYDFYAGPFSLLGLNFPDYELRIERNIVVPSTFWKKGKSEFQFFLKILSLDKTLQITTDDFKEICKKLEDVDTDSVEYFFDRTENVINSIKI
jgi:hypothetical protein